VTRTGAPSASEITLRVSRLGGPGAALVERATGEGWSVRLAACTYVNGVPDPSEPPTVHAATTSDTMSAEAALGFAAALHEAAIWARHGMATR
jgi:hypothetical protein